MDTQTNKNHSRSAPQLTPPSYFQTIVQPGRKYDCLICNRDTGSFTFIISNSNNYCIPCFSKLKKWPTSYNVINKLQFPVLDQNWSALDQIYLFQGLQKHGFGNWNQISQYISNNKTKQDVQKHYTQYYLNSPNFIPQQSKLLSNKPNQTTRPKSKNHKKRQTFNSKRIQTINQQKQNSKITGVEIVGYMPLRNDFQYQYDNQAQLLLAQMEFNDQDTEEQKQMKFKIIELYNKRLSDRNRKKQFILSRGILNLQKQSQLERTLPKSQKQIYNMMKIFSRFQTAQQHQQLVQGIIREKQLRQKIQQYKQLRRKGYTTKSQIQQQIQRKNDNKTKKKSTNQYSFSQNFDNRNNRRTNHNNPEIIPKKYNIYFSQDEIELLKNLKLNSISYMMIKQTIIREYYKRGSVTRDMILGMFSIDRGIINGVINFLVECQEIVCTD